MPGRMDDRQPMENSTKKWVTVLGASGSIGTNTLDVMARHPEQFGLFAITAATQVDKMLALCMRHQPSMRSWPLWRMPICCASSAGN